MEHSCKPNGRQMQQWNHLKIHPVFRQPASRKAHWANHQLSFRTLTGLHRKEINSGQNLKHSEKLPRAGGCFSVSPCIDFFLHFWFTLEVRDTFSLIEIEWLPISALACTVLRLESPMALTRPTLSRSWQIHRNSSAKASLVAYILRH